MELARDFLDRLLAGYSVLTQREQIEDALRERYRGHSQAALVAAVRQVFEAVDQSPLSGDGAGVPVPRATPASKAAPAPASADDRRRPQAPARRVAELCTPAGCPV